MTITETATEPTTEELEMWTRQVHDYLEANQRQRITPQMKRDLLAHGAKYCYRCSTVRAVAGFYSATNTNDGLRVYCRVCELERDRDPEYQRRYYEANRDRLRELAREYRERHPEKIREYTVRYRQSRREASRNWYQNNRERASASAARWRAVNPDYHAEWRAEHPWYFSLSNGFHRAVEAGLPADQITEDQLAESWEQRGIDPWVCYYTGVPLVRGENYSLDHVIPLSVPDGPGHVCLNLVPCDRSVNSRKGDRTGEEFLCLLSEETEDCNA